MQVTHELILRLVAQICEVPYDREHIYFTGSRRYEFGNRDFLSEPVPHERRDFDVLVLHENPTKLRDTISQTTMYQRPNVITYPYETYDERRARNEEIKRGFFGYERLPAEALIPAPPPLVEVRKYAGTSGSSGYVGLFGIDVNLIVLPDTETYQKWCHATNFVALQYKSYPILAHDKDFRVALFKAIRGVPCGSYSGQLVTPDV